MAWAGNRAYQAGGLNTADLRRARWGRGGGDGGRGGGGDDMASQMAMALNLLGLGPQQQQQQEELGLKREDIESQRAAREAASDVAAKTLAETTRGNLAAEDYRKWEKQQTADALKREMDYKTAQLQGEREKQEFGLASDLMKDLTTPAEQKMRILAKYSGKGRELLQEQAETAGRKAALDLLPKLQAVYAKGAPPEQLKTVLAGISEDVLQRPEIPWEQLNQSLGAAKQEAAGKPFAGALSTPWQEYQGAPDLSNVLIPAPPPVGTEGIAPWLRPQPPEPSGGAMDWRYGGGGPAVNPVQYTEYAPGIGPVSTRVGGPPQQEPGTLDRILATLGLK